MKNKYIEFEEKYQQLAVRERILVTISACAIIYLFFNFGSALPVSLEKREINEELDGLNRTITTLKVEKATLESFIQNDPNKALKIELGKLSDQLEEVDLELESLSAGLVSPDKLPKVLQRVLQAAKGVEFVSLRTLPVERLDISSEIRSGTGAASEGHETNAGASQNDEVVNVYRNTVELELKGDYLSIWSYLKDLESLSWRFYWDAIDYQVDSYPRANVLVRVYTISTEEGMLSEG